jgi:hypothetical protein
MMVIIEIDDEDEDDVDGEEQDDSDAADDDKASHAYTITHMALYVVYA